MLVSLFTQEPYSSFFCPIVVGETENRQPFQILFSAGESALAGIAAAGAACRAFPKKSEKPQTPIWETSKCFLHNQSPPAARANPQTGSLGDFAFCAQPRASDFSRQNKHYPKLAEQGGGYNTKRANKNF